MFEGKNKSRIQSKVNFAEWSKTELLLENGGNNDFTLYQKVKIRAKIVKNVEDCS